jgi:glycosyltransferase involved in cell wall biosynthesis
MKILVVSSKYYPEYSGSGFRAHNSYKRFREKFSISSDVVSSSLEKTGVKKYHYDNVIILRISGIFPHIEFLWFIKKIIIWLNLPFEVFHCWLFIKRRINNYDLLHTFGNSWSVGFMTWYFARFNKPIIRELCNDVPSPYYPKRFQRLIRPIFQKNNVLVVAISPKLQDMAKNHGVKNIWHRPNPVDEKTFFVRNTDIKKQLRRDMCKFDDNDIVMSSVANFSQRKNQLFLIKLLRKLPNKYKLILAGVVQNDFEGGRSGRNFLPSEDYVNLIKNYIEKYDLSDRVQLNFEFIQNPAEYMSLSDVYLFPSIHEGLGTPILEAQACGIPILANDLPGISDYWIKEGIGGYSVQLSSDLWVKKIMLTTEIKKDVLVNNSNYILSKASSNIVDKEYFDIFNKLIR